MFFDVGAAFFSFFDVGDDAAWFGSGTIVPD